MSKAEIEIAPGKNTRLTAEASGYYSLEAELLFSNLPDSGIIIEAQLLVLSGDTLIATSYPLHKSLSLDDSTMDISSYFYSGGSKNPSNLQLSYRVFSPHEEIVLNPSLPPELARSSGSYSIFEPAKGLFSSEKSSSGPIKVESVIVRNVAGADDSVFMNLSIKKQIDCGFIFSCESNGTAISSEFHIMDQPKKTSSSLTIHLNEDLSVKLQGFTGSAWKKTEIFNCPAIKVEEPEGSESSQVQESETHASDANKTESFQPDHNEEYLIRLTIINSGGEFTGGTITDSETKNNLELRIKEAAISSSMEFSDGSFFESTEYTDILHCYGPHVPSSNVLVEHSSDADIDDDYDRQYEEIFSDLLENTTAKRFTSSTPYLDEGRSSMLSKDDLVFYNQKIEKRIHYPAVVNIRAGEKFNLANVYIGSMNMDETISEDEIIEMILYIPEHKAEEYTKAYLGEYWSSDSSLIDVISDIFVDAHELKETIVKNHHLYPGDIEGKGEWENDYVKITTSTGEVLFEDGAY